MNNECLTMSLGEACRILGIGSQLGYKLARQGKFPGAISIGIKRIKVSKVIINRLLGVEENIQQPDIPADNKNTIKRLFSVILGKPLEEFSLKENVQDIIPIIKGYLPQRQWRVLELRFGLDRGRTRTLEEVGNEYGVTRERIRQIEDKTIRQLRHASFRPTLKEYIN